MLTSAQAAQPLREATPAVSTLLGASHGSTAQAGAVDSLWLVFAVAALIVGAIVYALILWSVFRYRKRGDERAPQFSENPPLEIAWTVLPLMIVAVLFFLTYRVERQVDAVAVHPAATIRVTAFRWSWRFDYQNHKSVSGTPQNPPQLIVPVGQTVRLVVTSDDVNHAFFVPAFSFKRDAIAGVINVFDLRAQREGTYLGECAEFCGLQHTDMNFSVRAVPPAAFAAWLKGEPLAHGGRPAKSKS